MILLQAIKQARVNAANRRKAMDQEKQKLYQGGQANGVDSWPMIVSRITEHVDSSPDAVSYKHTVEKKAETNQTKPQTQGCIDKLIELATGEGLRANISVESDSSAGRIHYNHCVVFEIPSDEEIDKLDRLTAEAAYDAAMPRKATLVKKTPAKKAARPDFKFDKHVKDKKE